MTVTADMRAAAHDLNVRFTYRPDPKWDDRWTVLRRSNEGDCDDYAVTIAWDLSGRSIWRMLRNVARGRARFWRCETAHNVPHIIFEWDGYYIDNMHARWLDGRPHFDHRRVRLPMVLLKLLGVLRLAVVTVVLIGAAVLL